MSFVNNGVGLSANSFPWWLSDRDYHKHVLQLPGVSKQANCTEDFILWVFFLVLKKKDNDKDNFNDKDKINIMRFYLRSKKTMYFQKPFQIM